MTHPTLFKRTKTGAIQQYVIFVTQVDGVPQIIKETGQLGGVQTPHREAVPEGKQKRTALEQAQAQATSDWKKKHDEGYKTLADLGGVQVRLTYDSVEYKANGLIYTSQGDLLQAILPQFNTDASGNCKPMLATDYKKIKKIDFPCIIEPKFDGVRALMILDEGKITFLSRTGKTYTTLAHIAKDVYSAYVTGKIEPLILDGEIFSDELSFQEIVSAVKAYKPSSLKLHFRVYDIVNQGRQAIRKGILAGVVEAIDSEYIQYVDWKLCHDLEEMKQIHDEFVQEGHEGAILRLQDGTYASGQRSRELLKVKQFDSEEFLFKNFEFGQRGVEDLIAVCWTADGNTEFRAKMVGTAAQKEALYDQQQVDALDGAKLTVKFFGYTEGGAGIPRFPIGVAFRSYE